MDGIVVQTVFPLPFFKHWIPFCNYFWSSSFLELPFGSHCSFFFRKWNKHHALPRPRNLAEEQTVLDFLGGCGAFRLLKKWLILLLLPAFVDLTTANWKFLLNFREPRLDMKLTKETLKLDPIAHFYYMFFSFLVFE